MTVDVENPCITHDMGEWFTSDRPRPCVRRDTHYAVCDDDTCRGCVPGSATHGHLCPVCYHKLVDGLSRAASLITHLRSVEKDGQALGERVFTSMQMKLVIPDTWLAADGLMEALGASPIPSTATIDDTALLVGDTVAWWQSEVDRLVQTADGAAAGVVFVKRMQTALARWPESEVHHRQVPHMLCPNCHEQTLYRRAPLEYLDELRIECYQSPLMYEVGIGYDYCSWSMDWFDWLDVYGRAIEHVYKGARRGKAA